MMDIKQLFDFASKYSFDKLPERFDAEPYTRIPIEKTKDVEIVVVCFAAGQTSSTHDHAGSNCVVRVVKGRVLETIFRDAGVSLEVSFQRTVSQGELVGVEGDIIHSVINLGKTGTVLLNFYSPPF